MVTFRDYMERVLYDPHEGYYGATRQVLADFYTAPEVHASFGAVLADDFARRLERLAADGDLGIVEMGCGDGRLAAALLDRLSALHPALCARLRYHLVERSPRFLAEALQRLTRYGGRVAGVADLAALPPVRGVFFSNELVDAFPVHLLEKRGGAVHEVYVRQNGPGDGVRVELGPMSRPELDPVAARVAPAMAEGDRHAVNLEAARWIREVAGKLQAGSLVTIDYGKRYPAGAVTPPRVFYRHRLEDFPSRPGREDITASVDFEALIRAGAAVGFELETYATLGSYLIERGILDHLPAADGIAAQRERLKIKTLFHPDGMGEKYKVLVQRKGSGC